MANFCVATKMQPSEYRSLTLHELNAYVEAMNEKGPADPLEDLI